MRRRFMLGMALVALSAAAIARASALPVHANVATPPAPPGAVYGGSSSQHHPMSLRVTHDGRQLKVMFVRVDTRNCSSSPERVYNAALNEDYSDKDVRLQADGRFATTTTLTGREEGGGRNEFELTVRGKAGRTEAFGTLRALAVFFDANDNVVDRCDTGAVRWS